MRTCALRRTASFIFFDIALNTIQQKKRICQASICTNYVIMSTCRLVFQEKRPGFLSWPSTGLEFGFEQLAYLADVGMAAQSLFAKDQLAVHRHFEHAALGRDELPRLDARFKFREQLVRQPDGAWCIVSLCTVFDLDVPHGTISLRGGFVCPCRLVSLYHGLTA